MTVRISRANVTATGTTTARSLAARFGDVLNVKDFGAVGDGATDDTAAFEAALAILNARTRIDTTEYATAAGGMLFIPRGKYRITRPLAITQDGVRIVGEDIGTTTLYVRLASNYTTTDAITLGDATNGGGRRGRIEHLTISSESNWGATAGFRDGIVIQNSTWWTLQNVVIRGAYRWGIRVRGTAYGTGIHVQCHYCGGGMRLERHSESGTQLTTVSMYRYYASCIKGAGLHVGEACIGVAFFDPIMETCGYAAAGGTAAADGHGIILGDTGVDDAPSVSLYNPVFEANSGWDIEAGRGAASSFCQLNGYGGYGYASAAKTAGYGHIQTTSTYGTSHGFRLTAGDYLITASLDIASRFDIRGWTGSQTEANRPTVRSSTLDTYGGLVEWRDSDGHLVMHGRYIPRVGGPGAADSIKLTRDPTTPTVGTYARGDLAFDSDPPTDAQGHAPLVRRCITAGTPGTWEETWGSRWSLDSYVTNDHTGTGAFTPSAAYRFQYIGVLDANNFTINLPTGITQTSAAALGRLFTVWVRNQSGGAMGTITWDTHYRFASSSAPASPANGQSYLVTFMSGVGAGEWYEVSRAEAVVHAV